MDLKIPDAEEINKQICEAIAKSAIGVELEKLITKSVQNLTQSYNNPFESIVNSHIHRTVSDLVSTLYKDKIAEILRVKMTDEMLNRLADKLFAQLMDR